MRTKSHRPRERRSTTPVVMSEGQKLHYLYEWPKLHKAFSRLTTPEKRNVLAAMDTSITTTWIQTAIDEQLELRKAATE